MARDHNNGWREASMVFLGAIIGGGIVALSNYIINERQIDVQMVEIAVGLLKENPNGPLQPARKWAVDVIQKNSNPRMSDSAYQALTTCRRALDLNDKFGRIGATAMEKAPGLRGAEFLPTPCLAP